MIRATYVACCSNFVDFQIDLFKLTDSFLLATVECNYAKRYCDHNIDYGVSFNYAEDLPINYDSSDSSSSDDNEESFKRARTLNSSAFYTKMRLWSLCFNRFCIPYQEILLLYFTNPFHIYIYTYFFGNAKKLVAMKFYVYSCLFRCYAYLLYIKEDDRLSAVEFKLRSSKWCPFVYCIQDFICICYRCLFSILKVKK